MLQAFMHLIYVLKIFCSSKAEFDNLERNKMTNAPTNLNNLKRKGNELDSSIKNCSCRFEKLNSCSRQ